jgi:hypothetical protein
VVAGDPLHTRSLVEVAWFYGAYSVQGLLMLPWNAPLSNYRLLNQVQRQLLPTLMGDRCPPSPPLGWGQVEIVIRHREAS